MIASVLTTKVFALVLRASRGRHARKHVSIDGLHVRTDACLDFLSSDGLMSIGACALNDRHAKTGT